MPRPTDILALLLLVACGQGEVAPSTPALAIEAPAPATGWAAEVAEVDRLVAFHEGRFDLQPANWIEADKAAGMLRQRARLTGDYADYTRAEALYARAFAEAPEGAGPLLGRARLHFTLHRLTQAEADLDTVEAGAVVLGSTRQEVADLRADIALERGQLDAAEAHWAAAEAASPTNTSAAALGRIAWLRGDFAAADAWFVKCGERYHAKAREPVAWVHLQRGLLDLDQGQPALALEHYRAAAAALPGYWLIEEHLAEALALTGQKDQALALYRDVVTRTGNPELQGALAEMLAEGGEKAEAAALIEAAEATYAARIEAFPEAATGHALEHALRWGSDPAAALEMAQTNATLRPSGAALALLSEARLATGDVAGAQEAASRGLATGTRSAALLLAAARAAQAKGDADAADELLAQALAIDPSSEL